MICFDFDSFEIWFWNDKLGRPCDFISQLSLLWNANCLYLKPSDSMTLRFTLSCVVHVCSSLWCQVKLHTYPMCFYAFYQLSLNHELQSYKHIVQLHSFNLDGFPGKPKKENVKLWQRTWRFSLQFGNISKAPTSS